MVSTHRYSPSAVTVESFLAALQQSGKADFFRTVHNVAYFPSTLYHCVSMLLPIRLSSFIAWMYHVWLPTSVSMLLPLDGGTI